MVELDRLVGLPSGQLIEVTQRELNFLMNLGFTEWSSKYNEFIFNDRLVDDVYRFLKRVKIRDYVKTPTGKKGIVVEIIIYNGKDSINRKNVSNIYNKGDKLFVIHFPNNSKGVYKEEQIEKVRPNSIFENYGSFIDEEEISSFDIVGLPSGQIIEIQDNESDYLKRHKIIKWNGTRQGSIEDYHGYTFKDEDYKTIMKLLYQLFQ